MTIWQGSGNGFDSIQNLHTILHMGFPNLRTRDVFAIATVPILVAVIAGFKEQRLRRGHGMSHAESFSSHAVAKVKT